MTRAILRAAPFAALALALAACEGGGTDPRFSLSIETVSGYVERGGTATVQVKLDGEVVDLSQVTLTANPADAVTVTAPGTLRFLRAGTVTLTAEARGSRGTRNLEVPAPPTVVFDRVAAGNRDLWKVALDGGDLVRLTEDGADDLDPTVAQGQVVFISYRSGNAELWKMPLAGGAAVRLTTTPGVETSPALSPDGERLAYTYDGTGVAKLWTARADGSQAARATAGFGFDGSIEASPAWAPSGNRLAFTATAAGSADLWDLAPPATPSLLAGGNSADVEPAWSPDGTRLAFASTRAGGSNTELYVLTVATGVVTRLTDRADADGQPTWTADGRLVYTEFTGGGAARLVWMDPAVPGAPHPIDTGTGPARFPAAVR